jgi:inositol transport system permease protein
VEGIFEKNKGTTKKEWLKGMVSKFGIVIAFLMIFSVMTFANPVFMTSTNLVNILKQASITSVIAIGTTFILISGGLDLSSGSVAALAGVCSAMFGLPGEYPFIIAFLIALAVGAFCGFLNGLVVAKGHVSPFITTLGMMTIARGMALIVTKAKPVFGLSKEYIFLGSGKTLGIPNLIIAMIVVLILAYLILNKSKFGRHIYAIGGNESSAYVSGINIVKTKLIVYSIGGALSGFAGLLLAGRIQSGTPVMGQGLELDAIAAAVIGGVSSTGGIGKVYGAVIGALMLAMVSNGLDLLNISPYIQQVIKGLIIVFAVFFDVNAKKVKM